MESFCFLTAGEIHPLLQGLLNCAPAQEKERCSLQNLKDRHRPDVLRSKLLAVYGRWQREGDVKNLIAFKLKDLSHILGGLYTTSRDFH